MFDPKEIIHCESYYDLADYHYKGQDDLPSGIVHIDTQGLPEFCRRVNGNGKNYIVICSRSDFGLTYQVDNPVYKDIIKWCEMVNEPSIGYNDIHIAGRLNRENCNINDRYSIKCWSFTSHTFNYIPENIKHLFITNNFINDDPRITSIPFGVNGTDGSKEAVNKLAKLEINNNKEHKMYMNFQFYTSDRAKLFLEYRNYPWVTTYASNRNIEEYYDDLSKHRFVLCPEGNGPDCYRVLETMYAGSIAVLPRSNGLRLYFDLNMPAVFINLNTISLGLLSEIEMSLGKCIDNHKYENHEFNTEPLKLSYWKRLIESKRELLS